VSAEDEALQRKIQEKFSKAKAGDGKFQVRVRNGTAYLSGRADVAQHKGAATRMAKTAGAKRVVNNITVSEAAKQKASRSLEQSRPRQATVKPAS
jgi:osmotically-inducible protein OsmY